MMTIITETSEITLENIPRIESNAGASMNSTITRQYSRYQTPKWKDDENEKIEEEKNRNDVEANRRRNKNAS